MYLLMPETMSPTTETEIKEIRDLVIGLREEMRLGFANNNTKLVELKAELKGEIQRVEAKTDTKFAEIKGELQRVEAKTDTKLAEIKGQVDVLEERTKIGFWGFVWRSVIIGILILLSGFAVRYVLFGTVKV
jgi:hypothetical protein